MCRAGLCEVEVDCAAGANVPSDCGCLCGERARRFLRFINALEVAAVGRELEDLSQSLGSGKDRSAWSGLEGSTRKAIAELRDLANSGRLPVAMHRAVCGHEESIYLEIERVEQSLEDPALQRDHFELLTLKDRLSRLATQTRNHVKLLRGLEPSFE